MFYKVYQKPSGVWENELYEYHAVKINPFSLLKLVLIIDLIRKERLHEMHIFFAKKKAHFDRHDFIENFRKTFFKDRNES